MMKNIRIIAIAALCAAIFMAAGVFVQADSASGYIKVGLKYSSSAPSSIAVGATEGLSLYEADGSLITRTSSKLDGYTSVSLVNKGSSVNVTDSSGNTIMTLTGDGSECIASSKLLSDDTYVSIAGTPYRGGVVPYLNASDQMNIINYVDVEDYLRSVVSIEMSPSWEAEALKAQAVAARSFILSGSGKHSSQGFDVCSTSHCQVYGGVNKEDERTDAAVSATCGEVIYYDGEPVAAYYSANSGGHTENSEDVWSAALGYLRGKADPYSTDTGWTVRITKAQLYSIFSARGVGDIRSVSIDSVNDSGYAASVTVTGSRSSYTVTKDSIRSMFGSGYSLKSRNFTFDTEGGTLTYTGSPASVSAGSSLYAVTSSGNETIGSSVSIVSESGTFTSQLDGLIAVDGSGVQTEIDYQSASASAGMGTAVTFSSDSDVLIINGKGNGHGVGMSQVGARNMAAEGFTYKDILKFYYTDIEVK